MHVFRCVNTDQPFPDYLKGGIVAIGNFDGVHRGHCLILEQVLKMAKGRPTLVLTFEPHPRTVLTLHLSVFRLTPKSIKIKILKAIGFSALVEYQFSLKLAAYSAEKFIRNALVEWMEAKKIVIGSDFHFGKNREGRGSFLKEKGLKYGFEVTLINELLDKNSKIISSSYIRNALENGLVNEAADLLGYHFTVESKVIHGQKLGRKLGYPTANMKLASKIRLKEGVYAVHFRTQEGTSYRGVANFGRRPTASKDATLLLETFLFDFSKEIYGQICTVSFFDFLRSEIKFDTLKSLIECMRQDEKKARSLLANRLPLSNIDRLICF